MKWHTIAFGEEGFFYALYFGNLNCIALSLLSAYKRRLLEYDLFATELNA
ncbi:hypothetical protein LEP1GSC051_1652 [Leptospira sp. P2653]|nr:hypothetical protein LEP1GSC051_1652 [Leptospira sp. P2653]